MSRRATRHLIIRHKSPRADHGQRHFGAIQALQPAQRGVLRVGQQHPAAAIFHADQPVDERQDVAFVDRQAAESCR